MKKPQPLAMDQIIPLLEQITECVMEECKKAESLDPKERARAEESIFELGHFGLQLMERLHPMYLRFKWMMEHAE
jgi:hypothetical protein